MASTKKKNDIFLIGSTMDKISENQLPSNEAILKYYYHVKFENLKMKHRDIVCCGLDHNHFLRCEQNCPCLLEKVITIYENAGIPMIRADRVWNKLNKLILRHKQLMKFRGRATKKEQMHRDVFKSKILPVLFDIITSNVKDIIENDTERSQSDKAEALKFVIDQRGPRLLYIGIDDTRNMKVAGRSPQRKNRLKGVKTGSCESEKLSLSCSTEGKDSSDHSACQDTLMEDPTLDEDSILQISLVKDI
ncbi:unnamed protein product [Lepeophtheirus salmonis]|uniref:(salmon louse) hypothetical protein n=1 Tax=Lepeophtheirus salmonis TaxID=72036 RepID=A0A0K2UBN8_LEPSM|nr:unnamed protein product [Lepeophtheirus salmonis]CAF3034667.1 unnamed protein product [Lepeophtheirus salmonis]